MGIDGEHIGVGQTDKGLVDKQIGDREAEVV